jgi:hypothetical protein
VHVSGSQLPSSYKDASWVQGSPNPFWPHLNLFISAKTLFWNKVTFWDSRWTWIWGDTLQTSIRLNNFTTSINIFEFHLLHIFTNTGYCRCQFKEFSHYIIYIHTYIYALYMCI